MRHKLALLLLALVTLAFPAHLAWAQKAQVTCGLTTDVVEVGEGFYVELRASVEGGGNATSPNLVAPPAFSVSGPSTTTTGMSMSFGQGRTQMRRTFTARWFVVANETGSFTLSNPTIVVDGNVVTASGQLKIKVVPVGQGPKKPQVSRRSSPFGGFGSFFGPNLSPGFNTPFFEDDEVDDPTELEPKARELMMKDEPDPWVFLRVMADKDVAMVGEQVTLSYYVYFRADMKLTSQREPPLTDFLRMDLERTPTDPPLITAVGKWRYHVKLLDQVAVFPLRAGKLHVGEIEATFTGQRFGNRELERKSNDLVLDVREPPLEDRPTGYRVGDVGKFRMQAEVKPRETTAGDTVAVLVRVSGRGMLPSQLLVPERAGIEWLKPEKKDDISVGGGRVGGWRSFGYAVRIQEEGKVDLGTIELPYWDPSRNQYEVATAELGEITVKPAAAPAPSASASSEGDDPDDPFRKLPAPRAELSAFEPRGDESFDPQTLWALVLAPPIGVAVAQLGAGAVATARRRRRDRKDDPAVLARQALADAKREQDAKDAAAAVERAVHLALESATGLKTRGILLDELEGELTSKGLENADASEAVALLSACSALRFEPDPDEAAGVDLVARARKLLRVLLG